MLQQFFAVKFLSKYSFVRSSVQDGPDKIPYMLKLGNKNAALDFWLSFLRTTLAHDTTQVLPNSCMHAENIGVGAKWWAYCNHHFATWPPVHLQPWHTYCFNTCIWHLFSRLKHRPLRLGMHVCQQPCSQLSYITGFHGLGRKMIMGKHIW